MRIIILVFIAIFTVTGIATLSKGLYEQSIIFFLVVAGLAYYLYHFKSKQEKVTFKNVLKDVVERIKKPYQ